MSRIEINQSLMLVISRLDSEALAWIWQRGHRPVLAEPHDAAVVLVASSVVQHACVDDVTDRDVQIISTQSLQQLQGLISGRLRQTQTAVTHTGVKANTNPEHAMTVATLTFERILCQSYCFSYSNWFFFFSWIDLKNEIYIIHLENYELYHHLSTQHT